MSSIKELVHDIGRRARKAARLVAGLSSEQKNKGLLAMAEEIVLSKKAILEANALDLENAKKNALSVALLDRLRLTSERLDAIAADIKQIATLVDPVGEVLKNWTPPNGLNISKVRVPIGVVGMIYESRPNVTSDAAVLCLKAGNAVILRGGSESLHSNTAIAAALSRGALKAGLPADSILLIPTTDREAVKELCLMDQYLDVIIPRGGKGLIETVVSHARMPVIKHYEGICAIYVDQEADLAMAEKIIINAKTQRPGVCNALETLLIHEKVAQKFLTIVGKSLLEKGVEIRGDDKTRKILGEKIKAATDQDYRSEFLDLILAVKIVASIEEALTHIEEHGSRHSDGIVTSNQESAERFLREVDSATVYWNASTRFTDGAEFGFGAEIGISTDKLHARGPMALEELTTYKYLLRGNGQIRE